MATNPNRIEAFVFEEGATIAHKYRIISKLGAGWEGDVYKVIEMRTGIECAAKLFFPHRNPNNQTAKKNAQKLHKLRHCSLLIHYQAEERILYQDQQVTVLISEYVEGLLLSQFLKTLPGKKVHPYQGLHILDALAKGIEEIHLASEYHGDLHSDNIIVEHFGLNIRLKVLDLHHWPHPKKENQLDDLCNMIHIFYECIGGANAYKKASPSVKYICCGLKRSLIHKKFGHVSRLRKHLRAMAWL